MNCFDRYFSDLLRAKRNDIGGKSKNSNGFKVHPSATTTPSSPHPTFQMQLSQEDRTKLAARSHRKIDKNENNEPEVEVEELPRVIFIGPPGAGKTTLAAAMATKYGCVFVSVDAEAKAAAKAGSEQGVHAPGLGGNNLAALFPPCPVSWPTIAYLPAFHTCFL